FVLDGGVRKVFPNELSINTPLFYLLGVHDATIECRNGAHIHAMHPGPSDTADGQGYIWSLPNNQHVTILNPSVSQEEVAENPTSTTKGIWHIVLSPFQTGYEPYRNIKIVNARQYGGYVGCQIQMPGWISYSDLVSDQSVIGYGLEYSAEVYHVMYPFTNQGGMDCCRVRIKTHYCGRSFFSYGNADCIADLDISYPASTSGNVLVQCLQRYHIRN